MLLVLARSARSSATLWSIASSAIAALGGPADFANHSNRGHQVLAWVLRRILVRLLGPNRPAEGLARIVAAIRESCARPTWGVGPYEDALWSFIRPGDDHDLRSGRQRLPRDCGGRICLND